MPYNLKPGEIDNPREIQRDPFRLLSREEQRELFLNFAVTRGSCANGGTAAMTGRECIKLLQWGIQARIDAYLLDSVLAGKLLINIDDDGDICFASNVQGEIDMDAEANDEVDIFIAGMVPPALRDRLRNKQEKMTLRNLVMGELGQFFDKMIEENVQVGRRNAGLEDDGPCTNPDCPIHGIPVGSDRAREN